jgi:hypothetical protein
LIASIGTNRSSSSMKNASVFKLGMVVNDR